MEKRYCPECQWRTRHEKGRCVECEHDSGPSERELEDEGQGTLLDFPPPETVFTGD